MSSDVPTSEQIEEAARRLSMKALKAAEAAVDTAEAYEIQLLAEAAGHAFEIVLKAGHMKGDEALAALIETQNQIGVPADKALGPDPDEDDEPDNESRKDLN